MNLMKWLAAAVSAVVIAGPVQAATVPFTEDFAADDADWKNSDLTDLTFVATGGPDGSGFVSGETGFQTANLGDFVTVIRGQDSFDSSNDAFVGNWITDGVTEFTAWVRHDAPYPLPMFARFATPVNFPGAAGIQFAPVLPFTWTQLTIAINPASPQIIFEGPSANFNSVFGNVGNIQIGVQVPADLVGGPSIRFDLDQPTITPEPASVGLFSLAALGLLRRRA